MSTNIPDREFELYINSGKIFIDDGDFPDSALHDSNIADKDIYLEVSPIYKECVLNTDEKRYIPSNLK